MDRFTKSLTGRAKGVFAVGACALVALALLAALEGCGQKGPLMLPPGAAPASGASAPR